MRADFTTNLIRRYIGGKINTTSSQNHTVTVSALKVLNTDFFSQNTFVRTKLNALYLMVIVVLI